MSIAEFSFDKKGRKLYLEVRCIIYILVGIAILGYIFIYKWNICANKYITTKILFSYFLNGKCDWCNGFIFRWDILK